MAGYYQAVAHAPLTILPINMLEDRVPLEFDMTLAVPRGRPDIKAAIETAVAQHKSEIRAVLVDFGVPLVKCAECTVSGDLPSHGPYKQAAPDVQTAAVTARQRAARMADLKKWLKEGANPNDELNNAIVADDLDRVRYLAAHGADVNAHDGEGYTPLISATRSGFVDVATFLAAHKADPNLSDLSGWTPLMWAAWGDDPGLVKMLLSHGAKLDATDKDALTPLAIAAQNGKLKSTLALIDAGADVNAPVAKGGYTPLMLAALSGSSDIVTSLIAHGARVNATNAGGVTALMIAAAGNRTTIAGLLLKSGADLNARSEDGRSALSIAHANNSDAVLKVLEDAARQGVPASG
jgi:ankyrin repeat protein